MSTWIEGHAEVSGPKWFVHSGEVETKLMKMLWGVSLKQTKTELNGGDVMIYQKENLYHNISRQVI